MIAVAPTTVTAIEGAVGVVVGCLGMHEASQKHNGPGNVLKGEHVLNTSEAEAEAEEEAVGLKN